MALAVVFGEEPGAALEGCCRAALAELTGRLRQGVKADSLGDVLIPAAAWLALSQMAAVRAGDGVARFAVGDLAVQKGGGDAARELRHQAEALMAPYLKDGFAFRGVRP